MCELNTLIGQTTYTEEDLLYEGLEFNIFNTDDDKDGKLSEYLTSKFDKLLVDIKQKHSVIPEQIIPKLTTELETIKSLITSVKNDTKNRDLQQEKHDGLIRLPILKDSLNEVTAFIRAMEGVSVAKDDILNAVEKGTKLIELGTACADKKSELLQLENTDITLFGAGYNKSKIQTLLTMAQDTLIKLLRTYKILDTNYSRLESQIKQIESDMKLLTKQNITYSLCNTYVSNYYRATINLQLCVRRCITYTTQATKLYLNS